MAISQLEFGQKLRDKREEKNRKSQDDMYLLCL